MLCVHCPSFCIDLLCPLSPVGTFSLLLHFPLDITCALLFPSQDHPHIQLLHTLLVSSVTPPKDLELGTADEREHMVFDFLGLGYLTQYDLF